MLGSSPSHDTRYGCTGYTSGVNATTLDGDPIKLVIGLIDVSIIVARQDAEHCYMEIVELLSARSSYASKKKFEFLSVDEQNVNVKRTTSSKRVQDFLS